MCAGPSRPSWSTPAQCGQVGEGTGAAEQVGTGVGAQRWGRGASLAAEALRLQGKRLHRRQTVAPKMLEERTPDTETLPSTVRGRGAVRGCQWPPGWPAWPCPPSPRLPLPWGQRDTVSHRPALPRGPSHPCGLQHFVGMHLAAGAVLIPCLLSPAPVSFVSCSAVPMSAVPTPCHPCALLSGPDAVVPTCRHPYGLLPCPHPCCPHAPSPSCPTALSSTTLKLHPPALPSPRDHILVPCCPPAPPPHPPQPPTPCLSAQGKASGRGPGRAGTEGTWHKVASPSRAWPGPGQRDRRR